MSTNGFKLLQIVNVIRNALHLTAPLVKFCITHNIYEVICDYTVDSYHILYYTSCLKYTPFEQVSKRDASLLPRILSAPQSRGTNLLELLVIFPFHLFGHYTWFDQCQHLLRFRHLYPSSFCCPFHPSSTVLFISLITRIGLIVFDHLNCV